MLERRWFSITKSIFKWLMQFSEFTKLHQPLQNFIIPVSITSTATTSLNCINHVKNVFFNNKVNNWIVVANIFILDHRTHFKGGDFQSQHLILTYSTYPCIIWSSVSKKYFIMKILLLSLIWQCGQMDRTSATQSCSHKFKTQGQ